MRKSISCILLATLIAVLPVVTLLCSCSGCSKKDMSAADQSAAQSVQAEQSASTSAVETKNEPAAVQDSDTVNSVAKEETAPAREDSIAVSTASVAEEGVPAESVAEKSAPEPVAEETPASEAAVVATSAAEESAEAVPAESAVEKAPAQSVADPAPAEQPSVTETAAEPATDNKTAASASESDADKSFGSHIITLGLSPWGWQHFHIDESGYDDKNSTYGLGGKLAYTYLFNCGFYVGAEAAFETYFIQHHDNFNDVMFFIDAGYNFALNERLGLNAGLGGGLELECYDSKCSAVGLVKADLGLGYALSEHFILGTGCDFIFSFPTKSSVNYMGFQIVPCITASFKF